MTFQRLRIWGIFEPEPGASLFRQVVEDLNFILHDAPEGHKLDVWFMFGGYDDSDSANDGDSAVLRTLLQETNIPLLRKLSTLRFSSTTKRRAATYEEPWQSDAALASFKKFFGDATPEVSQQVKLDLFTAEDETLLENWKAKDEEFVAQFLVAETQMRLPGGPDVGF